MASAVNLNGVECTVTDGELQCIDDDGIRECPIGDVVIPNNTGLTSIGEQAFLMCSGLTSVTFPEGLTSIGYNAFQGTGLTSVTFSEGLTSIRDSAFSECTGLTSVTFPEGLTHIRRGAFSSCSSLTSIELPSSLYYIGDYAFHDAAPLTSLFYKGSKPTLTYGSMPECSPGSCTEGIAWSNCDGLKTAYRGSCGCGSA